MHTLVRTIGAVAVAAAVAIAAISPTLAAGPGSHAPGQGGNQPGLEYWQLNQNHHYGHRWGGNQHRYYNRGYYGGPSYGPGYGYYGYGYDPGAAVAAGLIGGVFGTIAGAALSHSGGGSHSWRCAHTYRSYRPATNTFTGNDGRQHICRL